MISAVWAALRSNGFSEEDELAEEDWLVDVDGQLAGKDALTAVDWSGCDFGLKKLICVSLEAFKLLRFSWCCGTLVQSHEFH